MSFEAGLLVSSLGPRRKNIFKWKRKVLY